MRLALRSLLERCTCSREAREIPRYEDRRSARKRSTPRATRWTRASSGEDDDEHSVRAGSARGVAPDLGRLSPAALGSTGTAPAAGRPAGDRPGSAGSLLRLGARSLY